MIVLLIAGSIGGYYVGTMQKKPEPERKTGLTGEITIPVIHSTESVWEPTVVDMLNEEINDYLHNINANFTINFIYDNAGGSATKFLEMVQSYYAAGNKVIVGPTWSSHITQAKSYVDNNNILLFSWSSTSPALGIPNDNIYRLCINDTLRSVMVADLLHNYDFKAYVSYYVGDAWGRGMMEPIVTFCDEYEIEEYYSIEFPPDTDFIGETQILNDKIAEAIEKYGKEKVAVLAGAIAPNEIGLMQQASMYPLLSQVPWIIMGGCVESAYLEEYKEFAAKVGLVGCVFVPSKSSLYYEFAEKYASRTGKDKNALPATIFELYDIGWIITNCLLQVEKYDVDAIKKVLPDVCKHYIGANGHALLNSAGDLMFSDFIVSAVVDPTTPHWERVATFSGATKTFDWTVDKNTLIPHGLP
jgi:branched-chain amino acid transport system substrate-binding protein